MTLESVNKYIDFINCLRGSNVMYYGKIEFDNFFNDKNYNTWEGYLMDLKKYNENDFYRDVKLFLFDEKLKSILND